MCQSFPWTSDEFNEMVRKAVASYWCRRKKQARRQERSGTPDAGNRGEVTGGQHLNAFADLFIEVIHGAGYSDDCIHFSKPLVLPGYYRAQKKWDIVVTRDQQLLAAIELKSQSGSFGNNLNNRAEEVLGLAKDFWTAYREKVFGFSPHPWLGYFFLLEEALQSKSPVKLCVSRFPALPIFTGTSYLDRYSILCERLVLERDYTATALIASPKGSTNGHHVEPKKELSSYQFAISLHRHLIGAI